MSNPDEVIILFVRSVRVLIEAGRCESACNNIICNVNATLYLD